MSDARERLVESAMPKIFRGNWPDARYWIEQGVDACLADPDTFAKALTHDDDAVWPVCGAS